MLKAKKEKTMKKILTVIAFIAFMVLLKSQTSDITIVRQYRYIGKYVVTSYNAVASQCDKDFDIGAHGRVAINSRPTGRWFASNFMRAGTHIVLPEVTGNIVWTCRDHTNPKYKHRIDLLLPVGESIGKHWTKVYLVKEVQ
jgi:hypothetical protein